MRARSVLCLVGGVSLLLGLLASPASAEPERPCFPPIRSCREQGRSAVGASGRSRKYPSSCVEVAVDGLVMALRLLRTAGLWTERGLSRADKERPLE